jgi:hypothetical protein
VTPAPVLERLRRICLALPETSDGSPFRPTSATGCLGVRLDRGIDWDELAGIVEDAYAEIAPPKLVQQAFGETP